MAWQWRDKADITPDTSGDVTISFPTGTTDGDLVVVGLHHRGAEPFAPPTGFVEVHEDLSGNTLVGGGSASDGGQVCSTSVYYAKYESGVTGSTFTRTGGNVVRALVQTYYRDDDADPTYVLDDNSFNTLALGAASTTGNTGALDTSVANCLIVVGGCGAASASSGGPRNMGATDPSGSTGTSTSAVALSTSWALRSNISTNSGADITAAMGDVLKTSVGSTGLIEGVSLATRQHSMYALAFRVDVGGVVTPDASSHSHSATSPTITAHSPVAVNSTSEAHSSTSPTITAHSPVSVDSSTEAHVATSPTVTFFPTVAVADSSHDHESSSPSIAAHTAIIVNSSTEGHSATSPTITGHTPIAVTDSSHDHSATSPTLVTATSAPVDDSAEAHTASSPVITAHTPIAVASSDHAHDSSSPAITAHTPIAVNDSTHDHSSDSPDITAFGAGAITVAPSNHAHEATSPIVVFIPHADVDDSYHGHSSGSPAIFITERGRKLSISNRISVS